MNTNLHVLIISLSFLRRMRNSSDKNYRQNQKTLFMFNNFFENRAVYEIMWKRYGTAERATDNNMAHSHCMLDNLGYRCTPRICNNLLITFPR